MLSSNPADNASTVNMYRDKIKVYFLLFFSFTFVFAYYASANAQSNHSIMRLNKQKGNHEHRNSFFHRVYESYNDIYKVEDSLASDQNIGHYKRDNVVSKMIRQNPQLYQIDAKQREENFIFANLPFDISEREKVSSLKLFKKRLAKRNVNGRNVGLGKSMSKGKQKKAKVLGRLLMNNAANKNYEDIQDDYVEDEDDDYSKGLSKKKMNWENYQNEDGASVLELIALNTRHKTNLH